MNPPNCLVALDVLFFKFKTDKTFDDNPFFDTTLIVTRTLPPETSETRRGEMVQLSTLGGVESNAIALPEDPVLRINTTNRQLEKVLIFEGLIHRPYSTFRHLPRFQCGS
jgi:hypothetical protein